MKAETNLTELVNLYSLQKTLRFELIPQGETLQNIEKMGILTQDNQRTDDYEKVKTIIDEYHKRFIEICFKDFVLEDLDKYQELYITKNRSEQENTEFQKLKTNLRKQVVNRFKENDKLKRLFSKEFIKEDLVEYLDGRDEDKTRVERFKDFTTYFTGFFENRKNMYSDGEQSTAIAYRLIHENLPKFIDNLSIFNKIVERNEIKTKFSTIVNDLNCHLHSPINSIEEVFTIDYFNKTLSQKQIEDYNTIIGGVSKNNEKVQGLNEYINLYNQQQKDKSNRLPLLKKLFKQILSDREPISWLPEELSSDKDMANSVLNLYKEVYEIIYSNDNSLYNLITYIDNYDLSKIYISNDQSLTTLSQRIYNRYDIYTFAIKQTLKELNRQKRKENIEKYEARIDNLFENCESFSIEELNNIVKNTYKENEEIDTSKTIEQYFKDFGAINKEHIQKENLILQLENAFTVAKPILEAIDDNNKGISQDKDAVDKIKNLLDVLKDIQHFVKPLLGSNIEADKDENFYGSFSDIYQRLDKITPIYNMVRNYLTKKPYSEEKIKLNFEKGNLLNGWIDSYTEKSDNGTQYSGYLFRKLNSIGEYDYYLGISLDTKLFRNTDNVEENDKSEFERLDYYQLKSQTFFGNSYKGKQTYNKDKEDMITIIDDFIERLPNIHPLKERSKNKPDTFTPNQYLTYFKNYQEEYNCLLKDKKFKNKNEELIKNIIETIKSINRLPKDKIKAIISKNYTVFSEIISDIQDTLLKEKIFNYISVSKKAMEAAAKREQKTLYLFKISNKDLSYADTHSKGDRKSRGTENLHTIYFKTLMSGEQNVLDIGAGAIFYRKKTEWLKSSPTHKANEKIQNKNSHTKSEFEYGLIKDKRYIENKFLFHLSLTLNYQSKGIKNINPIVNNMIRNKEIKHIIGIDRGERNLLYLSLIDLKGNIVKQMSLNEIINEYNGNKYKTDYHDLLAKKEEERKKARLSWGTIENIKELKDGYISQVVHIISQMIVKYNAIVVLEDLNFGFMRGRQKIEKQVYQKFEKKLIDKLNYYVDKQKNSNEIGGLFHALQLTNKFESFKDMEKQNGCLFYIPAWNTSKIDPVTGFVNMFDTSYCSVKESKVFFSKFDTIRYNAKDDLFEFAFDYDNFTTKAQGTKTQWTLCSFGQRIEIFRNKEKNNTWDNKEININDEFKQLFNEFNIDININDNLKQEIQKQTSAEFFKRIMHLMKLLLQIRNSITGSTEKNDDYIISPVADENGVFFDSRKVNEPDNLPIDADANGAYNIARKGLWVVRQIQNTKDEDKINLAISNKGWLNFVQQKLYLND